MIIGNSKVKHTKKKCKKRKKEKSYTAFETWLLVKGKRLIPFLLSVIFTAALGMLKYFCKYHLNDSFRILS